MYVTQINLYLILQYTSLICRILPKSIISLWLRNNENVKFTWNLKQLEDLVEITIHDLIFIWNGDYLDVYLSLNFSIILSALDMI